MYAYRLLMKAEDLEADIAASKAARKNNGWGAFGGGGDYTYEMDEKDKKPLPVVQGVKFRGYAGSVDKNIAFSQAVITLFQFLFVFYANREVANDMFVPEEICQVGLECSGLPKVMAYIIWIVDKLLTDRIENMIGLKCKWIADDILIFFSMASTLIDLEVSERDTAKKWLIFFNDKSVAYNKLKRKGLEMSSLS